MKNSSNSVAFIGSAGVPNNYGGFESFLEAVTPTIARKGYAVYVTCDASRYADRASKWQGVNRIYIPIRANGWSSVFHDFFAFFSVLLRAKHIVFLGVSGGVFFPLFGICAQVFGAKIFINVDGIEWRRGKFGRLKKFLLRIFDYLAQFSSDAIIYDNEALLNYIPSGFRNKSVCIAYSGCHVIRCPAPRESGLVALTVCRIEPENNIELALEGFLESSGGTYTIVGNWGYSSYSRNLYKKYSNLPRINLMHPIYDPIHLANLRERASVYIHGHSVGGTNPSLVEMLFYDCQIFAYDCEFNRSTAGSSAQYFSTSGELTFLIKDNVCSPIEPSSRESIRVRYTAAQIVEKYIDLFERY